MGSLFTEQTLPDPCAEGEGIWDESQKFGASKIGDSLFGSIEKAFEADVSKVKDIYLKAKFGHSVAEIIANKTIIQN